ncbi:hypothetical protein AB0B45_15315 [Nonomuraea sp. NPDC049152]|uniref:hypothetical protein n=1 Tax=Nonomuraea sp. NPDC049152 TaxID=3154350 RepID=UPI003408E07D
MARDLVAAAQRWTVRRFRHQVAEPDQSWQHSAWGYYDNTPEVRFAAAWIGNAMGKGRLFAGRRDDDGTVKPYPDSHRAAELVASIGGGPVGQSKLLAAFGPHLVVAGEGWIVIRPKTDAFTEQQTGEDWRVLSVLEMKRRGQDLEAEIDGEPVLIPQHDPANPDRLAPRQAPADEETPDQENPGEANLPVDETTAIPSGRVHRVSGEEGGAIYLARHAEAYLALDELDAAVETAERVLDLMGGVDSARGTSALDELRSGLLHHKDVPVVQSFLAMTA